jgi:hypothetical protein
LVSVVLLCCFSSYSLAYDQQYTVGGTGPQGGTVTEVSIASVLDSTSTQQIGDNLETVTVTKFTETVIENVTSTNQVQQTTINTTETSTGDVITNTNINNSKVTCAYGSGSGFYRDPSGCGSHTRAYNDLHIMTEGQHQYTTDTDHWMNQESLNYGFSATADAQAKDSSPSNTQFSITVKLYDPDTGANTQETNTWTLTNSYQDFSTTLNVGTNTYGANSQIVATFLAVDPSYDGYGFDTDVQNFNLGMTYQVLETVVETINQTITNSITSAIDTLESQTSLIYNPLIQPGTDTSIPVIDTPTANQDSFTVNVAGNNGGGMNLQFNVEVDETANVATVEMASTNLETGVVSIDEVASISLDFSTDSGGTTSTTEMANVAEVETQVTATVETAVAEATTESTATTETTTETEATETEATETEATETEATETASTETETESTETASSETKTADAKSKSKSKTKLTKEQKREKIEKAVDKAKQKIARKILMAMADTYNAINESTKIALMASLTDTDSFKAYQKKNNEDLANWYSDLQVYKDMPQLIDPAAQLYELASDKIMNEMIDEQYK